MQKTKVFWLVGLFIFVVTDLVLALVVTVKHEPNFYRQSQIPASPVRKELADTFLRNFGQMMLNIQGRQEDWGCDATEEQLNSFFEEGFVRLGEAESLSRLGISSPIVTLDGERIRMAFRYGKGGLSTIISYELKIWLVPKEPNVVAVQVLSARAGALPISCQTILHQLSEMARRQNYEVTLYRHEGTPVTIIRLQPEQPHPISTLVMLKFDTNLIQIRGKTLEHALPPPMIKPGPIVTPQPKQTPG